MAVFTRIGHQRIVRLYADRGCYDGRELVQVWTVVEGRLTPEKRFVTDLVADHGHNEILDIVRAEAKVPSYPRITAFAKE